MSGLKTKIVKHPGSKYSLNFIFGPGYFSYLKGKDFSTLVEINQTIGEFESIHYLASEQRIVIAWISKSINRYLQVYVKNGDNLWRSGRLMMDRYCQDIRMEGPEKDIDNLVVIGGDRMVSASRIPYLIERKDIEQGLDDLSKAEFKFYDTYFTVGFRTTKSYPYLASGELTEEEEKNLIDYARESSSLLMTVISVIYQQTKLLLGYIF